MKRLTLLVSTVAIVFGCVATHLHADASPVHATLVLPDRRTLPGVPFEGWIDLENVSAATVAVGLAPHLRVASSTGGFVEGPETNDFLVGPKAWGDLPAYYIQLSSGERRTITLPIGEMLTSSEVFADQRISTPGAYTISLRLDAWTNPLLPAAPLNFAGAVLTDAVSIERIEPRGDDAIVWARLQEIAKGQWTAADWISNFPVAVAILKEHPNSAYVPYAVLAVSMGNVTQAYLDLALRTIDRFPTTPVKEMLQSSAAFVASDLSRPDIRERQLAALLQSDRPTTQRRISGSPARPTSRHR
jgi:hypothetical protein